MNEEMEDRKLGANADAFINILVMHGLSKIVHFIAIFYVNFFVFCAQLYYCTPVRKSSRRVHTRIGRIMKCDGPDQGKGANCNISTREKG